MSTACSARLSSLLGEDIDLILLDIMLSTRKRRHCRLSGDTAGPSSVLIIMLTALASPEHVVRGLDVRRDHVAKPFSAQVMLARIRARLADAGTLAEASATVYRGGGTRSICPAAACSFAGKRCRLRQRSTVSSSSWSRTPVVSWSPAICWSAFGISIDTSRTWSGRSSVAFARKSNATQTIQR